MPNAVTTQCGRVAGLEGGGLKLFRGIPYAASTAGAARFRAPRPVAPWQGVRDATRPGPTAPQVLGMMRDLPPQDEDCLHLNVWTPGTDARRRPVIVFIHGGGFTTGASTNTMYDATALSARGDVVVVSMNYRLGVLGFAYLAELPGLEADANNGMRDIVACLHWVRDNIEAFGGDPENVTLMGQSAGAMIACTLTAVPSARGLFRRVIAQSGAAHHVTPPEQAAGVTEAFLAALSLSSSTAARLRELPLSTLLEAQEACRRRIVEIGAPQRPMRSGTSLAPVVDGEFLPAHPLSAAAACELPILLGSNLDECNFWIFLSDHAKRELDQAALLKVVEYRVPGHGRSLIAEYTAACQSPEPWRLFSAIESDRQYRLPAIRLAEARRAPSYLYAFDWCSPLFEGQMGSCHTLEVPFVLGQVEGPFGRVFVGGGADAVRLSERMMDAWLAFARGSDPSTQALGSWLPYEKAARSTMQLSRTPRLVQAPAEARRGAWDAIV